MRLRRESMDIVFCKNIDSLEEEKFVDNFIIKYDPEVSVIEIGRGILNDKKIKKSPRESKEIIEKKKSLQYDILILNIFYVYKENEKVIKSYIGKMYISGLDLYKLVDEVEKFKYKVLDLDSFSGLISLSTSDFYYNLYDKVGKEALIEFLKAVRDANIVDAEYVALQRGYLELIVSTIRFGEEELYDSKEKAFTRERLDYIIGESSQFIENIKSEISFFKEDKDISWELYIGNNSSISYFHKKGDDYYNDKIIGALIGANGVGKSSTLRNIAEGHQKDFKFIYTVPSIREEIRDRGDNFSHPEDLEYNILREYAGNIKNILENDGVDLHNSIIRAVSILDRDELFKTTGFVEYFRKTSSSDGGIEYSKLSSGQINIIYLILYFLDSILENYKKLRNSENGNSFLLLIDEPENALHPPLIVAYLRILYSILKIFNGCALIATHSPVLIQELTSNLVLIVSRKVGEAPTFCKPEIETYGENIGILTDRIFGRDPLNTGFRQRLKNIVSSLSENELSSPDVREKYIYPKIGVTSLGMEASMVLNGLISSRRKNIELKEKNSEDSR